MRLEHVMDLKARLREPYLDAGRGPFGSRYVYTADGGSFAGPRLRGRVLPGGGDWPLVDANGTMRLDIRVLLETDDGALISLRNHGVWRDDPAGAPADGAAAAYGERYIMSTPRFETGDDRYRWLNDHVFVAEGKADLLEEDGYLAEVSWRVFSLINGSADPAGGLPKDGAFTG